MANKKIQPRDAMDVYEQEMGINREKQLTDSPKMFDYYWHQHHMLSSQKEKVDENESYIDSFPTDSDVTHDEQNKSNQDQSIDKDLKPRDRAYRRKQARRNKKKTRRNAIVAMNGFPKRLYEDTKRKSYRKSQGDQLARRTKLSSLQAEKFYIQAAKKKLVPEVDFKEDKED